MKSMVEKYFNSMLDFRKAQEYGGFSREGNMTVQEFMFSPFYWIHASIEYLKASKRLTAVEKLSKEGKIPYSEHRKAFDEYQPYYDATWKYFTPMCILIIGCMVVLAALMAITMGHI